MNKLTLEEYNEQETYIICRNYRTPGLTVWDIAEIFSDDDIVDLVKKRINILTRQRNKLKKPYLLIDVDLRWVKNEVNQYRADKIDDEIKSQKLLLNAIESNLAKARGEDIKPIGGITELDKLRAKEVPIKELLGKFGVEFKRDFASCVWHSEDTGSLHYIKSRNTVHCHGACSRSYDTIDVVKHFNNCGFIEAVKFLTT